MLLQHLTRSTAKSIQKSADHPMNCEIAPKKSRLDLTSNSEENGQEILLTHENILQNERYFTNSIRLGGEKVKFINVGCQVIPKYKSTIIRTRHP